MKSALIVSAATALFLAAGSSYAQKDAQGQGQAIVTIVPSHPSEQAIQVSQQDITFELGRLQRNYQFLSYGLVAAWIILLAYVLMMVGRQKKLKREIASLRTLLEEKRR